MVKVKMKKKKKKSNWVAFKIGLLLQRTCEICGATAKNVAGEQSNQESNASAHSQTTAGQTQTEIRGIEILTLWPHPCLLYHLPTTTHYSVSLSLSLSTPSLLPMAPSQISFSLVCVALLFFSFLLTVTSIGINYGQVANNLPPPKNVIPLLKSVGATKVKLYDADPQALRAFSGSGFDLTISLGNEYLAQMKDSDKARDWVKQNVQAYLPGTKIVAIVVGNEVLTSNQSDLSAALFPAMQSIHGALVDCGLNKQIFVTTAHSLAILDVSYPPSATSFRHDLLGTLTPILDFHVKTGSPILINAYPFFAYEGNPKHISLDFVLFQPNQGFTDPGSNFHYDNMLFAQVDAVYHALDAVGISYKKVPIVVSETGWPSNGDPQEVGANCDNARKYNGNLIKMMMSKKMRTPIRPDCDLTIFVFALFNENMKPGKRQIR
ncbi:hypothetical protein DY000_02061166 [Brassica cretica]|uniref:glucan endo-1,3-beta-D-glucosidase n=1 Tax=Brassica cretica TaxID=69181 RepID=A0ABQ7AUD6_BRACR|nr:hypothetical protein DY000_02061166 [Brassica cretica]